MIRILLVDDNSINRLFFQKALSATSEYSILSAADGFCAFNHYRAEKFDLVLTDLEMPGMSGIQLIQKILALNPDQTVIAMSGGAKAGEEEWLAERNILLLHKPISLAVLHTSISCALDRE